MNCKPPPKKCKCGHYQAQHVMGTGFCGARTGDGFDYCGCGKFEDQEK